MHRVLTLAASLALALWVLSPVAAQDGPADGDDPAIGDAVSLVGPEGTELGVVTVEEMIDPFEDYDPDAPPARGHRFVLLTVTVENTGSRPLAVNPTDVFLQDTDGFTAAPSSVVRGADARPPDLAPVELATGDSATGAIGFQVLNGVEIARVFLSPTGDRLVLLADLGAPAPAIGEAVVGIGPDGTEIELLAVEAVTDPFEDYDPGSPPARGNRFVLVTVTIANTGSRPLAVNPSTIYLQDADGFAIGPSAIRRGDEPDPPDLQFAELAPGDEVTGTLGYQVLNGVAVARVVYQPSGDRLLVLADLGGPRGDDATPAADDA